jgi:hypothetical protein
LVFVQSLRLAVGEIDRARAALAPAVIHRFILRQTPARVIAVIGDLMIKLVGRGMQLEHPLQTPARFVEEVGDAVGAGQTRRIDVNHRDMFHAREIVAKSLGIPMFRTEFVREEHLRGGIAGREQIFQQIASIMPAAARIQRRAVGQRPKNRATIGLMTVGVQPRIEAAALLPHEFQELRHGFTVRFGVDIHRQRFNCAQP